MLAGVGVRGTSRLTMEVDVAVAVDADADGEALGLALSFTPVPVPVPPPAPAPLSDALFMLSACEHNRQPPVAVRDELILKYFVLNNSSCT